MFRRNVRYGFVRSLVEGFPIITAKFEPDRYSSLIGIRFSIEIVKCPACWFPFRMYSLTQDRKLGSVNSRYFEWPVSRILYRQLREEPSGWSNRNGFHAYNCLMAPACLGIITRSKRKGGTVWDNGATVLLQFRSRIIKLLVLRVYCQHYESALNPLFAYLLN